MNQNDEDTFCCQGSKFTSLQKEKVFDDKKAKPDMPNYL